MVEDDLALSVFQKHHYMVCWHQVTGTPFFPHIQLQLVWAMDRALSEFTIDRTKEPEQSFPMRRRWFSVEYTSALYFTSSFKKILLPISSNPLNIIGFSGIHHSSVVQLSHLLRSFLSAFFSGKVSLSILLKSGNHMTAYTLNWKWATIVASKGRKNKLWSFMKQHKIKSSTDDSLNSASRCGKFKWVNNNEHEKSHEVSWLVITQRQSLILHNIIFNSGQQRFGEKNIKPHLEHWRVACGIRDSHCQLSRNTSRNCTRNGSSQKVGLESGMLAVALQIQRRLTQFQIIRLTRWWSEKVLRKISLEIPMT